MITINKLEYFVKPQRVEHCVNEYTFDKPWLRIYTSKGEIEIPLDTEQDEAYYIEKFQELSKLASGTHLNMAYDFREDE